MIFNEVSLAMTRAIQRNPTVPIVVLVGSQEFRFTVTDLTIWPGGSGTNKVVVTEYGPPVPERLVLICAPNAEIARTWAMNHKIRNWTCVNRPEHLYGFRDLTCYVIGSGKMTKAFRDELKIRQRTHNLIVIKEEL